MSIFVSADAGAEITTHVSNHGLRLHIKVKHAGNTLTTGKAPVELPRPAVCSANKGKDEHVRIDVGTARLVAAKHLRVKSCAELQFALAPAEEDEFEGFASGGSEPRMVSRTPGGASSGSEAAEAAEAPALPAALR